MKATVRNRLKKKTNQGYKLKPRETHQPQEKNNGTPETLKCNKKQTLMQNTEKRTIRYF